MNSSKTVGLILTFFVLILVTRQEITITCQQCASLCQSGLCAVYHGRTISLSSQEDDKSCISSCQGFPMNLSPSYCEMGSDNLPCESKCCVGYDRLTFAQKTCTNTLGFTFSPERYCQISYKNEQGFGFFAGSMVLLTIFIFFSCCVYKACQPDKTVQQIKKEKENHVRRPRKLSKGFFGQCEQPIVPKRPEPLRLQGSLNQSGIYFSKQNNYWIKNPESAAAQA